MSFGSDWKTGAGARIKAVWSSLDRWLVNLQKIELESLRSYTNSYLVKNNFNKYNQENILC